MTDLCHEGPELLEDAVRTDAAARLPLETVPSRPRILVVEDSLVVRLFLKHSLEAPPVEAVVDLAHDGVEALTRLRHLQYSLIVCDLDMPVMDGRTFCRVLRARHAGERHRIIIFTSNYHCRTEPQFDRDPDLVFLQKPSNAEALQNLVLGLQA
jgi:CheY-like chemotaxis protein